MRVFIRTWRGLEANGEHVVVPILKICSITNIGRVRGQGVRVGSNPFFDASADILLKISPLVSAVQVHELPEMPDKISKQYFRSFQDFNAENHSGDFLRMASAI